MASNLYYTMFLKTNVKHQKTLETSVIHKEKPSTSGSDAPSQSQGQQEKAEGQPSSKPMKVKVTTNDSRQVKWMSKIIFRDF